MKKNRAPLVPPPEDESTTQLILNVKCQFVDFLARLRTFYGGARQEQIVESLVRYAAEKREHFLPANYEPYVTDEPTQAPAKHRSRRTESAAGRTQTQLSL